MSDAAMMGWSFALGVAFTLVIILISRAMFSGCTCEEEDDG